MTNYWVLVAPKNQVLQGMAGSFAQANHGKAHPLRRMKVGDGLLYYSPKTEHGGDVSCKAFTAIGCVIGEQIYQSDQGNNFIPHRRDVKYLSAKDAPIAPLIQRLAFIKDKEHWGHIFKFGILHIPAEDFKLIATMMNAKVA